MSVGGRDGAFIRLFERSWDGCSSLLVVGALRVKARRESWLGWSRCARGSKSEMESQEETVAL